VATEYKVLAQETLTADTNEDIYSVPAGKSAVISTITIANTTASAATYRLAVTSSATAASAVTLAEHVAYDVAIASNDTVALTLGITAEAGKKLVARCNSASVAFNVFGSEVS
jgi:hypothetical protein